MSLITGGEAATDGDQGLRARVEAVLDMIRPAVQGDGGDIELMDIVEGTVPLRLGGGGGGGGGGGRGSRSVARRGRASCARSTTTAGRFLRPTSRACVCPGWSSPTSGCCGRSPRSEEHTSELQ